MKCVAKEREKKFRSVWGWWEICDLDFIWIVSGVISINKFFMINLKAVFTIKFIRIIKIEVGNFYPSQALIENV